MHPGKLNPSHSSLYVSYGGKEVPMQEYEILIQVHICALSVQWETNCVFKKVQWGSQVVTDIISDKH